MELNVETVEKEERNYSIVRTEQNGIKIVEINEKGCDYHDFVLVYYKAAKENFQLLEQFHTKYKINEKTVCFIGLISEESGFKSDFSEYKKFFDLNGVMIAEDEYESIVLSAYSCRSGLTHGDPQDWLNFKSSEDLCCLEETGTSVTEMADQLCSRFKKLFTEHPESKKMKNGIVSVIANGFDDLPLSDLASINKLSEFFEDGYSLIMNVNTNCDKVAPGTLKMTLI